MQDRSKAAELAAVLDWYREMGAEEAIGEMPVDWLQRGEAAPGAGFAPLLPRSGADAPAPGAQARAASPLPARIRPRAAPASGDAEHAACPGRAAPVPNGGTGGGRHGGAGGRA